MSIKFDRKNNNLKQMFVIRDVVNEFVIRAVDPGVDNVDWQRETHPDRRREIRLILNASQTSPRRSGRRCCRCILMMQHRGLAADGVSATWDAKEANRTK